MTASCSAETRVCHYGTYSEVGGVVTSEITSHRHNDDPNYVSLLGADIAKIEVTGSADGNVYAFVGGSPQMPGAVFRSVMTPIEEDAVEIAGGVGEGGVVDVSISVHIRLLDGVLRLTGRKLLNNGRILGGDAFFYYIGTYTSSNGRWKGQIVNQEHTPAKAKIRFSAGMRSYRIFRHLQRAGAELEATALAASVA